MKEKAVILLKVGEKDNNHFVEKYKNMVDETVKKWHADI